MAELAPIEVLRQYGTHDSTLQGFFNERATRKLNEPFLVFQNQRWTWSAFAEAIDHAARALKARGIDRGDRIAIVATNSFAHVLLLFAAARLRAILVPLNPEYGVPELRYVLEHSEPKAVFCSDATFDTAQAATGGLRLKPLFWLIDGESGNGPTLSDLLEARSDSALPEDVSPEDTFTIIYSSGTTGFPKGVMHSQRSFVLAGEQHLERTHLQPSERTLCILPLFHVNALFYSVAGTVAAGACLVIAPRFSASQFWRLVADTGATQVNLVVAMTAILARRSRSEFVPGHALRLVYGAPFTQEVVDAFRQEFGVETIIEGFGMTEVPGAFNVPYEGPHKIGCMGTLGVHPDRAQPWALARVVDDAGHDVPDGVEGDLLVQIPTIMQGYYRDDEQTRAAYCDDWFITGDVVRRDADGYYWFVARKKDIIRRRGENIAGAELDRVIGEHPAVAEVAAIGVESELGEDEIMIVVVARANAALTPQDVKSWCAERLAPHKLPRFVSFADALPHTSTHKVAKFLLKKDASIRERAVDLLAIR